MENWYLLSLVGKDRPGIVAQVSASLCKAGCNLGDSTMARLGENFCIMVMVYLEEDQEKIQSIAKNIAKSLDLHFHLDSVSGSMEHHIQPDVRISVYANDRLGIVEDVTTALAEAGLNIIQLDSNLGNENNSKNYYIHIEGTVSKGLDPIYQALEKLKDEKFVNSQVVPINPDLK